VRRLGHGPKTCIFLESVYDEDGGGYVPPKRRLTFNGLYGVISHKIVLFRSIMSNETVKYTPNTTLSVNDHLDHF
jgi:hypothetical protein